MERSADRALYLRSGDWRVLKRVRWRGTGEIKVALSQVDAVRKGQGHAGSTPATSTILTRLIIANFVRVPMSQQPLPAYGSIRFLTTYGPWAPARDF